MHREMAVSPIGPDGVIKNIYCQIRLETCKTWQEMLDLVIDVVGVATQGVEKVGKEAWDLRCSNTSSLCILPASLSSVLSSARCAQASAIAAERQADAAQRGSTAAAQSEASTAVNGAPKGSSSPSSSAARTAVDLGAGLAAWVAPVKGVAMLHIMEKEMFGMGEAETSKEAASGKHSSAAFVSGA